MNSVLVLVFGLVGTIHADQWKDKVRLTCESTGMKVEIPATEVFKGVMWIEGSGNPSCVARGSGSKAATVMFIPYDGCNTMRASNSLYVNKISFKQRAGLVSSRDSVLEVVCRLKSGQVKVNSEKTVFSIITDGVRDITRTVATPDEPTLSNVKLLRDNISGKQKFRFGLHLPQSTTSSNLRAPTVRNCSVIQDNVVLSTLEQSVSPNSGSNEISVDLNLIEKVQVNPRKEIGVNCIMESNTPAPKRRQGRQLPTFKFNTTLAPVLSFGTPENSTHTARNDSGPENYPGVVSFLHGMPAVGVWQPVEEVPRVRHHSFRKPPKQPLPVNPYESTSASSTTVLSLTWLMAAAALILGLLLSLALNCFLCRKRSGRSKRSFHEKNLPPYQTYEATSSCGSSSFAGDGECESVLDDTSSIASSVPSHSGFVIKYPSRPPRPEDIYGFTVYGANRY